MTRYVHGTRQAFPTRAITYAQLELQVPGTDSVMTHSKDIVWPNVAGPKTLFNCKTWSSRLRDVFV